MKEVSSKRHPVRPAIRLAVALSLLSGGSASLAADGPPAAADRPARCLAIIEAWIGRVEEETGRVAYPAWQARDFWQARVEQAGTDRQARERAAAEASELQRTDPSAFDAAVSDCHAEIPEQG